MHLRRVLLALATLLLLAFVAAALTAPRTGSASPNRSPSAQAATIGEWSAPEIAPGIVHAAVLATGKVLGYSHPSGLANPPWVWDPSTMTVEFVPVDVPNGSIFCSAQSFLADGRLLVTGGHLAAPGDATGIPDIYLFDPFTEEWTPAGEMAVGRWYPTNVLLGDGRTLVFAGNDEAGIPTDLVEVYDPASGMELVPGANRFLPVYPRMHLLPSGKVFVAGPQELTGTFDPATVAWQAVDSSNNGYRGAGASVLLPLQPPEYRPKVLIVGGGEPATETAEIIDLADPAPTWGSTGSMNYARRNLNAVLLPDGKILAVGGNSTGPAENPVLQAEIFDPVSETWTEVASMERPRVYHSIAILLPDGRVAAGGSDGESTVEFYSPPYLFQGQRPQISFAPEAISYGNNVQVSTPDAQDIAKVVLMRPAAVTHSVDMEQRYLELDFQASANSLTAQVPANPNLAPPGYYMLFIVNSDGVPSEAMFTRLAANAVGGVAELAEVALMSLEAPVSSGPDAGAPGATIAGAAMAGILALSGAAWYAWKRRPG
ncbi:MAG: galactose oxidase-like domain-containing protein [Dehalococcoidia bacterium]